MLLGSIVLAGGRSRRMGQPKESLRFGADSLLGRTVATLLDCTWPVVVVSRDPAQALPPLPLEARVVHDRDPGAGPLAAMATGMRELLARGELGEHDAAFVCGCDAPFLDTRAVGWLAAQLGTHRAVMPHDQDRLQPLCAVYRLDILPVIDGLLAAKIDTPRTLAEKVDTVVLDGGRLRGFDPELRFLRGVNTPEQYRQALADAGLADQQRPG